MEDAYPIIIDREIYEQAHRRWQLLQPGKQLENEIVRRLERAEA